MEILGVGPWEFLLIIVLALVILGPKDMAKAGRTLGKFMRRIVMSSEWQALRAFSKEMTNIPTRLMREAQFDEISKDIHQQLEEPIKEIEQTLSKTSNELTSVAQETGGKINKDMLSTAQSIQSEIDLSAWTNPNTILSPEKNQPISIESPPPPTQQFISAQPDPILPSPPQVKRGPVLLTAEPDDQDP